MSFDTLIKRFIGRRSFWKGTQLTFASLKCAFVVNQLQWNMVHQIVDVELLILKS